MRIRVMSILVVLLLTVSSIVWPACTSNAQPTDEEILKAIDDSGTLNRTDGSITVIPPVQIVEKGRRNKDGSWPVKVRFKLTVRMKDGQNSPPTETTTAFKVFREKEAGKAVWKARPGA